MNARCFVVTVSTSARRAMVEPGSTAVALGFYAVVVVVISSLWRAAVEANGGEIVGYSAAGLTWYIVTSEAVVVALSLRLIEEIGDDIASGAVATEQLRPASVLGIRLASEIGTMLPRLGGCAVVGMVIATASSGGPPDGTALALAGPALALGVVCNLLAQHAFAAAAFWVRDARSTWFLYQKFVFILGGMLLPLEVLPGWLHSVATVLPFMAMTYVPAHLASGHVEPELLLVQVGWLAVLFVMAVAAFAAGERRLQVVGG